MRRAQLLGGRLRHLVRRAVEPADGHGQVLRRRRRRAGHARRPGERGQQRHDLRELPVPLRVRVDGDDDRVGLCRGADAFSLLHRVLVHQLGHLRVPRALVLGRQRLARAARRARLCGRRAGPPARRVHGARRQRAARAARGPVRAGRQGALPHEQPDERHLRPLRAVVGLDRIQARRLVARDRAGRAPHLALLVALPPTTAAARPSASRATSGSSRAASRSRRSTRRARARSRRSRSRFDSSGCTTSRWS